MEPILNVEKEVDCVVGNFVEFNKNCNDNLNNLIESVESLRDNFNEIYPKDVELTDSQINSLNATVRKIKEVLEGLGGQHKKIHMSVSKLGKTIDKNFCRESQASSEDFFINLNETNKFTLNKNRTDDELMEEDLDELNDRSMYKLSDKYADNLLTPSKQLKLINKAILQHFLRVGQSEVANELMNEAGINVEDTIKWPFNELNAIVEALKRWNLEPALDWALNHQEQLEKRNSILIFALYKLKFIEMLKRIDQQITDYKQTGCLGKFGTQSNGKHENSHPKIKCEQLDDDTIMTDNLLTNNNVSNSNSLDDVNHNNIDVAQSTTSSSNSTDDYISKLEKELILFARSKFQPYFSKYALEIQQLMCCLVYLPYGIRRSPYKGLFNIQESEVIDLFTREACSLLGLSVESPLIVTFNAGCKALPALINIRNIMEQGKVSNVWNCRDELPIGIDLGKEKQYHSIFACPILKEQSKESNPPMRLTCGHVISKDALNKLASGSSKLKCPYCPIEQNPSDAKQIVF